MSESNSIAGGGDVAAVEPSELVDRPATVLRGWGSAREEVRGDLEGQARRRVELSVVIPVFEEEECLSELHGRLRRVMDSLGESYEIIYVDDGSRDGSLGVIRDFARKDPAVRYISFTRNFGQGAAIRAGQMASTGLAVIILDADLQNPPEEIPRLLAQLREGHDVVYGVRRQRQDPWIRKIASGLVGRLLRTCMQADLQPNITAFTATHRRFVDELNRCPEQTRFDPALCAWLGARTTCVDVRHEARFAGKSKYNLWRLFTRALDLFTGFTQLPLRLATWSGLVFSAFGFSMAAWAIFRRIVGGHTLLGWSSTMAAIGLLGGVQLLTIGVLGEYLGRAYTQLLGRPLYVVRETERPGTVQPNHAEAEALRT